MSAACFVDTFALLAALNTSDARHGEVVSWLAASRRPLVTTEWVLTELADGMCMPRQRTAVLGVERRLRARRPRHDHRIVRGEVPSRVGPLCRPTRQGMVAHRLHLIRGDE